MLVPLQALDDAVGKSAPTQNLNKALHAIFAFHQRVVPMLCGLFAEPELLAAYRESLTSRNKGPQGAIARLKRYITAEQKLGRLQANMDAEIAATTLMANSFLQAFLVQFFDTPPPSSAVFKRITASILEETKQP